MTRPTRPTEQLTIVSAADTMGARAKPLDWKLSRRIVRHMWRYRALFITTLLLASLLAIINGALPHLAGLVLDGPVIDAKGFEESWNMPASRGLLFGALGVAFLGVMWMLVMRLRFVAVARMAERVAHDLRTELFRHLHTLSMDYFDRTKVGWIIARGGGDINEVRGAVSQVIPRILIATVQMLYAMVAIALYDWVMLLILLAIAPVVWVVNYYFRKRLSEAHRRTRATFSTLTANLAESVSGMRVTQAFVREERNAEMFHELCMEHRRNHLREARAHGMYVPTLDLAGQIFIVLALLVGGYRVSEGLMGLGTLVGVMLMTRTFFQPITVIGEMYNLSLQAMAGAERVFGVLDTKPSIVEPKDPTPLPRTDRGARVEFDHVTFRYIEDQPVLDDVSFTAEPGQTVAIVGHTGAGKTTVISLIAKFYDHRHSISRSRKGSDATAESAAGVAVAGGSTRTASQTAARGYIRIDGIDIHALSSHDLHSQMAMVQQHNFLFHGSVMDNIRFAKPDATDEEVVDVCRRLDCLDILETLPQGLRSDVGERGENLSLGQRQLVCFARAMLARPRILLLDEATSAVDTVTEMRVQRALEKLLEGRTSFVVAHRLSTIRRADLVLVMDRGRIIERGTHQQLISHGGVYAELYDEFVRLSTGE